MFDDNLNFRYRAFAKPSVAAEAERHINIHRQGYNYTRYQHNNLPDGAEDVGSTYKHHNRLPKWKKKYPVFKEVHSKALQRTVKRYYDNLDSLEGKKKKGYNVGRLKWQSPTDYRSVTYNQSGFSVDHNTGRPNRSEVELSKIGTFTIHYHRDIPNNAEIKEVTLKKEKTGEWYCTFTVKPPVDFGVEKPDLDSPSTVTDLDVVGIDIGILKYAHDTSGNRVESLDVSEERDRLERAQRALSRKKYRSKNWEKQRQLVAKYHAKLKRKRKDFLDKLSTWYTKTFDVVAVEDLNIASMIQGPQNSRNKMSAAWGTFTSMLDYKGDVYGCHVVEVEAKDTTKACSNCGVKTKKELWVREHSCPSCGFRTDRDLNAAYNILAHGLSDLGVGHSESTPVKTVLPTGTLVPAKHVIEAGSPILNARSA